MGAEFSECGKYRYVLTRKTSCPFRWVKPALFIMLNPSTADEIQNDPTIRRCISFAEGWGCTELTVVNLFALRATNPLDLKKSEDPIGPLNDLYIAKAIEKHKTFGLAVAAWGAHPFARERAREVLDKFGPFFCLGKTQAGAPKHPLYLRKDSQLISLR